MALYKLKGISIESEAWYSLWRFPISEYEDKPEEFRVTLSQFHEINGNLTQKFQAFCLDSEKNAKIAYKLHPDSVQLCRDWRAMGNSLEEIKLDKSDSIEIYICCTYSQINTMKSRLSKCTDRESFESAFNSILKEWDVCEDPRKKKILAYWYINEAKFRQRI